MCGDPRVLWVQIGQPRTPAWREQRVPSTPPQSRESRSPPAPPHPPAWREPRAPRTAASEHQGASEPRPLSPDHSALELCDPQLQGTPKALSPAPQDQNTPQGVTPLPSGGGRWDLESPAARPGFLRVCAHPSAPLAREGASLGSNRFVLGTPPCKVLTSPKALALGG